VKIKFTEREALVLADPNLGPGYFTLKSAVSGRDPDPGGSGGWINTKIIDLDDVPILESDREQTIRIEKTVGCELLNVNPGEGEYDFLVAEVDLYNNDIELSNEEESDQFNGQFGRR
jgi:hypothetical protein